MGQSNRRGIQEIRDARPLSEEEIQVLRIIVNDRIWWESAKIRARRAGFVVVSLLGGLALLASWWPWITHIAKILFKDVPTN